jgi:3'-phosphoadenosine 5'-phosphosulfate sulfotransferase (PAPS reductase)/FAD synthetase
MADANIISMSGGKDSTAMALLALEQNVPQRYFVFADTGHEHQKTYEYLDYLEGALNITIDRVKANFDDKIAHKRDVVNDKWRRDGVSEEIIERALSLLHPTGNPFLDLCLWKGRFPSTRRRFCSEELKHYPMDEWMDDIFETYGYDQIISWQGVRRDESQQRANLLETEDNPNKDWVTWYRPILDWTAKDCFDMHAKYGIEPNPLYKEGMGRVGCMPCIHATKGETMEIAMRFPEELERLAEWERIVSQAAKRQCSTFFDARVVQKHLGLEPITSENVHTVTPATHGVAQYVEWSKTARGGRQYDLIKAIEIDETEEAPMCKSIYGLCE